MEEREEVPPQAQSNSLVLEPFRLQRRSFDGKNHTLGIAPHDREETGDVLQVTGYVSDLFQHLYAAEVSILMFYSDTNVFFSSRTSCTNLHKFLMLF